jgi:hypothetical protein
MTALTQQADLAFGEANEHRLTDTLNAYFNTTLERRGGYNLFDYIGNTNGKTIEVELKTRRIPHDKYPTALIGYNKVAYCDDPDKDYYFVFCYSDGIYYIKYDPKVFIHFDIDRSFVRSSRSDCSNTTQTVLLIPTTLLNRLEPV